MGHHEERAKLRRRQGVRPVCRLDLCETLLRHDVVQAEDGGPSPHTYPRPSSMSWMRFSSSLEYWKAFSGNS